VRVEKVGTPVEFRYVCACAAEASNIIAMKTMIMLWLDSLVLKHKENSGFIIIIRSLRLRGIDWDARLNEHRVAGLAPEG